MPGSLRPNYCLVENYLCSKQTTGKSPTPRPCAPEPSRRKSRRVRFQASQTRTEEERVHRPRRSPSRLLAGSRAPTEHSAHSCSASVIAGEGVTMQRDHASHCTHYLEDLEDAETIGRRAGDRAVAKLNPSRPKAGRYPMIFDPRVSSTLLGHFCGAITGSAIARKTSFLQDKLGQAIFSSGVTIVDDPLRRRGLRSRPFDGEGVRVSRQEPISGGVLRQWIADSASARQLAIAPTGHAARGVGGAPGASPSNLFMEPGSLKREELLASVGEAVLVTELIGQGVNGVTGDYSRGASGFMVRGGEIAEAIAEITIAGNLIEMFASLEPASDLEFRRGIDAPTILIPEMTIAAA